MRNFCYRTFAIILVLSGICLAAPEPALVPGPLVWTVDVKFEHPQQIELKLAGEKKPTRFWYTILTLANNTKRDVDFFPKCELMTNTLQVIPAGRGVPDAVFEQIKLRHQSKYPFLENLEKTSNKLLQGQDNAKDVAVIWSDFDPKAKGIKLFIAGLSNETVVIDHPRAKDQAGEPVNVFLRKTLAIDYKIGGDPAFRSDAKVVYKGRKWVLR